MGKLQKDFTNLCEICYRWKFPGKELQVPSILYPKIISRAQRPIPKPGKDDTDPSNYRPIVLTSCLYKTLEHMINTRLIWFLASGANGVQLIIWSVWKRLFVKPSSEKNNKQLCCSTWRRLTIPHGNMVSCVVWMISVLNADCPGVDCSLYGDECLICYRSKHMHSIERQLQQCLNKIQKWAFENGVKFSQDQN